jgi:hypothetical protein
MDPKAPWQGPPAPWSTDDRVAWQIGTLVLTNLALGARLGLVEAERDALAAELVKLTAP